MNGLDLEAISKPFSVDDLLEAKSQHRFERFKGSPGSFDGLVGWQQLNEILERSLALPPRVRLVKAARAVDHDLYVRVFGGGGQRLDCDACLEQLREGATLIVDSIDELVPAVGSLCRRMEQEFRAPTQANLYAAWRSEGAFDLHWDPHDALILQIAGRKHWKIYRETVPWPMDRARHYEQLPGEELVVWEGELEDGDALFIPRGWWHAARPCGGTTMHLTFGINTPTGLRLLEWLASEAVDDEFLRRDIPTHGTAEELDAYRDRFRTAVMRACQSPELLRNFLTLFSAKSRKRERARLGASLEPGNRVSDDAVLRTTVPFSVSVDARSEQVEIGVQSRVVTMDRELASVFARIHEQPSVRASVLFHALRETHERAQIEGFLTELQEAGVISVSAT